MRASRLPHIVSVGALAFILLACAQPGHAEAPVTPAPQAPTEVTQAQGISLPHGWTLMTYTAAIPYAYPQKAAELKVSAGCQPGERMVGAGYAATDVFEYNANIFTSYPTDDHTWVASGGSQAGIELDVYCLHGDNLPTVVIASATSGAVACPADSVLLSEGFGQQAPGATMSTTSALCATSGVEAGATPTAPVTFDSNHNGYMSVSAYVKCPAGQVAFGGGSTGVDNFASGASADFTSWGITGGGGGKGAVYADCVRLV